MNKINDAAFNKGLRTINESGINRILSHGKYGMVIISANRSEVYSENPQCDLSSEYETWCKNNNDIDPMDDKNQTLFLSQRNDKCDRELHDILKSSKYAYSPVYGGYHGNDDVTDCFEPSYIVYNHVTGGGAGDHLNFEELEKFAIEMAKKYKQESVYIQKPDEAPKYVNQDGEIVNSDSSEDVKVNRYDSMFYSTIKRDKTKPQRVTADICFESMYRKAGPSTFFDRVKRMQAGEVFLD